MFDAQIPIKSGLPFRMNGNRVNALSDCFAIQFQVSVRLVCLDASFGKA
jgi:hypothetical protein